MNVRFATNTLISDVVARAAVRSKNLSTLLSLSGGQNYMCSGVDAKATLSLLSTDQKREKEHPATMLRMAATMPGYQKASPAYIPHQTQAYGTL